jgi:hypothetical protein
VADNLAYQSGSSMSRIKKFHKICHRTKEEAGGNEYDDGSNDDDAVGSRWKREHNNADDDYDDNGNNNDNGRSCENDIIQQLNQVIVQNVDIVRD